QSQPLPAPMLASGRSGPDRPPGASPMAAPSPRHYKHNRLQQLRGFCAAARLGSVSRAAESLRLSQPSVSLQIKALERELGVRLFERRGPKIVLTPDGKLLGELAAGLVRDLDRLHEVFAARR